VGEQDYFGLLASEGVDGFSHLPPFQIGIAFHVDRSVGRAVGPSYEFEIDIKVRAWDVRVLWQLG
jgi:hypothetical protein